MASQTPIKASPEQADSLRQFALALSARIGRRVSLGAAIAAAVAVAEAHTAEADAAALAAVTLATR